MPKTRLSKSYTEVNSEDEQLATSGLDLYSEPVLKDQHSRQLSTRAECEHSQQYAKKQLGRTTSLRTDPCFGGRKSHCVGTRSSRGKVRGLKLGTSLCL